ncbi:MAG TPA: arginine deiminase family protein [Woeseiaceae bacterium]|nr:arginine deiminase family protein [Woeseiaceae bacterium]
MAEYGSQSMVGRLRRAVVRAPDRSFAEADPDEWHYAGRPELEAARAEHGAFTDILERAGVELVWHDEPLPGLADAIFTHDSALVTNHGSIILRMGKALRQGEEEAMARVLARAGVPELGRLHGDARAEGGDLLWLDEQTLAVGVGFRTNSEGADQLAQILAPIGVSVRAYDLPYYEGPDACLHLMSLISMIDDDLAVVFPPLLPVRLVNDLADRGIRLLEVPEDEFVHGQATNVLALAPRDVLLLEGNPVTVQRLREAGCRVATYRGDEISRKAEGGATCLTRPVLRDSTRR